MQALRYGRRALTLSPNVAQPLRLQSRTFTNLITASSRPSLLSSSTSSTSPLTPSTSTLTHSPLLLRPTAASSSLLGQIRSFSASACLAGKRLTYNPSRRVQKRRHGFLARLKSRSGREILKRRRLKGRKSLSW